jgi:hypothetical protein
MSKMNLIVILAFDALRACLAPGADGIIVTQ